MALRLGKIHPVTFGYPGFCEKMSDCISLRLAPNPESYGRCCPGSLFFLMSSLVVMCTLQSRPKVWILFLFGLWGEDEEGYGNQPLALLTRCRLKSNYFGGILYIQYVLTQLQAPPNSFLGEIQIHLHSPTRSDITKIQPWRFIGMALPPWQNSCMSEPPSLANNFCRRITRNEIKNRHRSLPHSTPREPVL